MNREVWRDIKGYEGLYQVSNYGRIKSLYGWNGKEYIVRERILRPCKSRDKSSTYSRSIVKLIKDKKEKIIKFTD